MINYSVEEVVRSMPKMDPETFNAESAASLTVLEQVTGLKPTTLDDKISRLEIGVGYAIRLHNELNQSLRHLSKDMDRRLNDFSIPVDKLNTAIDKLNETIVSMRVNNKDDIDDRVENSISPIYKDVEKLSEKTDKNFVTLQKLSEANKERLDKNEGATIMFRWVFSTLLALATLLAAAGFLVKH